MNRIMKQCPKCEGTMFYGIQEVFTDGEDTLMEGYCCHNCHVKIEEGHELIKDLSEFRVGDKFEYEGTEVTLDQLQSDLDKMVLISNEGKDTVIENKILFTLKRIEDGNY